MGFDRALSSRTPCWSHQPRTNHGPWGGRSLPSALPYATLKKDVLTTHCAQSTFMGYYPQGRKHTRCNHDTEKSGSLLWGSIINCVIAILVAFLTLSCM